MSYPPKGKADYLELGSNNVQCYECGMKFKAGDLRKHWRGYYVCPKHWEPRQPQDFVKGVKDIQTPPWVQPLPDEIFVQFCTVETSQGIAGVGVAGCAKPGAPPDLCTSDGRSSIADKAVAGCSKPE